MSYDKEFDRKGHYMELHTSEIQNRVLVGLLCGVLIGVILTVGVYEAIAVVIR